MTIVEKISMWETVAAKASSIAAGLRAQLPDGTQSVPFDPSPDAGPMLEAIAMALDESAGQETPGV